MKLIFLAFVSVAIVSISGFEVNNFGDTKNFKLIDRASAYAPADPEGTVTRTFTFPPVINISFFHFIPFEQKSAP